MRRARGAGLLAVGAAMVVLAACGSDGGGDDGNGPASSEARGGAEDGDGGEGDGAGDGDDGKGDENGGDGDGDGDGGDDGKGPGELPDSYDFTPDPDRVPATAEDAQRLTENAVLTPDSWGQGMTEADPYERAGTWTSLPDDCVWTRVGLPDHVLDSRTRRMEIPAADGRGMVQGAVTVTVHRTEEDAARELEDTVQESFRCPEQDLGGGHMLSNLMSLQMPDEEVLNADATLFEAGDYTAPGAAESHPFVWTKSRIAMVTTAVSVRGAEGYEVEELIEIAAWGGAQVLYNVELELQ